MFKLIFCLNNVGICRIDCARTLKCHSTYMPQIVVVFLTVSTTNGCHLSPWSDRGFHRSCFHRSSFQHVSHVSAFRTSKMQVAGEKPKDFPQGFASGWFVCLWNV